MILELSIQALKDGYFAGVEERLRERDPWPDPVDIPSRYRSSPALEDTYVSGWHCAIELNEEI